MDIPPLVISGISAAIATCSLAVAVKANKRAIKLYSKEKEEQKKRDNFKLAISILCSGNNYKRVDIEKAFKNPEAHGEEFKSYIENNDISVNEDDKGDNRVFLKQTIYDMLKDGTLLVAQTDADKSTGSYGFEMRTFNSAHKSEKQTTDE